MLRPNPRRALTILHIVTSVGLAGNIATILAIALASGGPDTYRLIPVLVRTLGLPLLATALTSGVLLAWFTPWGLFRHGWVVMKLLLLLAVLVTGGVVLRPAMGRLAVDPMAGGARTTIIACQVFQLLALTLSAVLSVAKPRGILPRLR